MKLEYLEVWGHLAFVDQRNLEMLAIRDVLGDRNRDRIVVGIA